MSEHARDGEQRQALTGDNDKIRTMHLPVRGLNTRCPLLVTLSFLYHLLHPPLLPEHELDPFALRQPPHPNTSLVCSNKPRSRIEHPISILPNPKVRPQIQLFLPSFALRSLDVFRIREDVILRAKGGGFGGDVGQAGEFFFGEWGGRVKRQAEEAGGVEEFGGWGYAGREG